MKITASRLSESVSEIQWEIIVFWRGELRGNMRVSSLQLTVNSRKALRKGNEMGVRNNRTIFLFHPSE